MSHTALIALWRESHIWSWQLQGPPPPLDHLVALAAERIAGAEAAAKHLEPPTLSGYMMTTGNGYRTIGDDIAHMRWIAERWTLALACPDDRPPLYWQLIMVANDAAPWLSDDEAGWISQVWRDHPSPIGEMISRAWRTPTPWPGRIEGCTGRRYPAQHDQAALVWWFANANEVEREHCRQRMPWGAFDALHHRFVPCRPSTLADLVQLAGPWSEPHAVVLRYWLARLQRVLGSPNVTATTAKFVQRRVDTLTDCLQAVTCQRAPGLGSEVALQEMTDQESQATTMDLLDSAPELPVHVLERLARVAALRRLCGEMTPLGWKERAATSALTICTPTLAAGASVSSDGAATRGGHFSEESS